MDMKGAVASTSLNKLCGWLARYYGNKCIVLLDEYDTPLQEAYVYGFWDAIVTYIRALLNNTFKTNPALDRALMTGITRVSRDSIFPDLNNLNVVTTTSDEYAAFFGFTEAEVFASMDAHGMTEQEKQDVKMWYDEGARWRKISPTGSLF